MSKTLDEAKADLAAAEAELNRWEDAFDRYSGNNPNKYRSDINAARRSRDAALGRVRALERLRDA